MSDLRNAYHASAIPFGGDGRRVNTEKDRKREERAFWDDYRSTHKEREKRRLTIQADQRVLKESRSEQMTISRRKA